VVQVFEVAEYSNIPVIAMEYSMASRFRQILNDVGPEIPLRLQSETPSRYSMAMTGMFEYSATSNT